MIEYFRKMALKYNIPLESVISIALNRYGIIASDIEDNRIRFYLKMLNSNNSTFFAVCVNTYLDSPFIMKDSNLFLDDVKIGTIFGIEKDTCNSTYFRNEKKDITFNSNSRSQCRGCKFCGTYSLETDSINFSNKENIIMYFKKLLSDNNISDMGKIDSVTICTGCFKNEDKLVEHLLLINDAFKSLKFNGSINYIGSQLRDYNKIKMLKQKIPKFGIYLSLEKFLDREKFMRPEKSSLTIEEAHELLSYCKSLNISTTFLYILGLEDLETLKKYFEYLKDSINKFPIVQVFQDYTSEQEEYRCNDAKNIEYYLMARKIIDDIFKNEPYNPKLWECFRSLYYEDKKTRSLKYDGRTY